MRTVDTEELEKLRIREIEAAHGHETDLQYPAIHVGAQIELVCGDVFKDVFVEWYSPYGIVFTRDEATPDGNGTVPVERIFVPYAQLLGIRQVVI